MNNYKKIILDNGIPLYLNTNKNLKQVYVGYVIGYGSSGKWFDFKLNGKEYHVLPGYAHYLEHLLGERSKNGNIYTNFVKKNYDANACTSQYYTCYHFLGVEDIYESIKELIEAIDDPVFTKEDVEKTRRAIEREATMTLDNFNVIITNIVTENLYKNYNSFYKTMTSIGDKKTTRKIDYDTLKACYEAFYHDNNKKLVISGNVDEKEIVDYLNNLYKTLPKHEEKVELKKYDFDPIKRSNMEEEKDIKKELNAIGIKVKRPNNLTREEVNYCLEVILEYIHGNESQFSLDIKNKRLLDVLKFEFLRWNGDYVEYIHSFISDNSEDYYKTLMDEINKKKISKEEYESIKKTLIAEEVRALDNKYDAPENFETRITFTERYSDIDFFSSIDYDRFSKMYESIDFNNSTKATIKKLTK